MMNIPKIALILSFTALAFAAPSVFAAGGEVALKYPIPVEAYGDGGIKSLWEVLSSRVRYAPFNFWASLIFLLAIIHTFSVGFFNRLAHRLELRHEEELKVAIAYGAKFPRGELPVSFRATACHYLGEVEAVFGIWLIPLFLLFAYFYGWSGVTSYIDNLAFTQQKYTEPMFVVIVMCIAATKPVIYFAGHVIHLFAKIGKSTPAAWWVAIFAVGPILGSFITEPAAITICAMLLFREFYELKPSTPFKYATLGLLLTTISAGGTLTHFAAPPVLMVAKIWEWDTPFMFVHFGWKAWLGILLSVGLYYMMFKSEFKKLNAEAAAHKRRGEYDEQIPKWVIFTHIAFLAFTVFTLHHPALFMLAFLFFLAFTSATRQYQYGVNVKTPILVGFFLAGLVTHGSLQAWWIEPILGRLSEGPLFFGAIFLTAFNDNAAITYLASMVPNFSAYMQYIVVAGAVTGGGLTVIANAPNPAALSILKRYYKEGISPLQLFFSALPPTAIIAAAFYFL